MQHYAITPKLPVPSLNATLDRFLTSLKPLLTPTEFSEAVKLTKVFSVKQGPYLQQKLVQLADETENWAGYVSVQARYLGNRSSLVLTNGIGTLLRPINIGTFDIIHSMSLYFCSALSFFEQTRDDKLPQDMFDGEPLCMRQYKKIFGVARLPGLKIDSYSYAPASRHIVAMHRGCIYKVPVYRRGTEKHVNVMEMYSLLSQVLTDSQGVRREAERSVGLLTALKRDQWYLAREQLMESPVNRESLAAVEGCLFGVFVDDYEAERHSNADKQKLGLFGDLKKPYFNRWFGLSRQHMVSADGYLSGISEHSLFDGGLATEFGEFHPVSIDPDFRIDDSLNVEMLKWDISPLMQAEIERARAVVSSLYAGYDVHTFRFNDYGKYFVKNYSLYFQGYIQLALQLAYYKIYHGLAGTYQPVSLRKYCGGRLEHPHIVSEESRAFVEAMSRDCTSKERYRLMRAAMDRHARLMSDVHQGQVYCKHMLGLRMLADREGLNVELFQKEIFKAFTEHKLASSGVYGTTPRTAAHPIPSSVGHFVLFQVEDSAISFSVTTLLHSAQAPTSQEFAAQIGASLREIQQLVVTQSKSKL